jgi:hypothetical protein
MAALSERLIKETIMPSTLAQKFQIKPCAPVAVINAPQEVTARLPQEMPNNPLEFEKCGKSSATLIFVKDMAAVDHIAVPLMKQLDGSKPVWLAHPKGTSGVKTDINRDILWKKLDPEGWGPARMIALDEVWSCMRFSRI